MHLDIRLGLLLTVRSMDKIIRMCTDLEMVGELLQDRILFNIKLIILLLSKCFYHLCLGNVCQEGPVIQVVLASYKHSFLVTDIWWQVSSSACLTNTARMWRRKKFCQRNKRGLQKKILDSCNDSYFRLKKYRLMIKGTMDWGHNLDLGLPRLV